MVAKWSTLAEGQLKKQIECIKNESPQNAEKVKFDIVNFVDKVLRYPESYSLEANKKNNDGTYRYFEKHRIRISYRVLPNEILIVRVRHTSMKPREF